MLQHAATPCSTLQHTATHCNTLQYTTIHCHTLQNIAAHSRETLQHTATHCNTLQHTATYCNTLPHTAPHCHCNTLQHTATHIHHTCTQCEISSTDVPHIARGSVSSQCIYSELGNTLHHSARSCNTLQHTSAIPVRSTLRDFISRRPSKRARQRLIAVHVVGVGKHSHIIDHTPLPEHLCRRVHLPLPHIRRRQMLDVCLL